MKRPIASEFTLQKSTQPGAVDVVSHGGTWDGMHVASIAWSTTEARTLMKSAPALLSALESMVEMFERNLIGQSGPDDAAERWDQARAVIAQARGQTDGAQLILSSP